MKKNWLWMIPAMALTLGLGSCKSKESAYKAAYEKAQEKPVVETPAPEPVVVKPVTETPTSTIKTSNEKVTTVNASDASKLKLFNVVVGSFSMKTNASGLQESLVADGYDAFLVQNPQGMYRVIAGSFDERTSATNLRESIKSRYPNRFNDAWLLIKE
ncbi:MAG: SPOR domain-containing protein [Coprobacter sp.]|nr:SPOR domain-containing protein [Coprobacter sp.]